MEFTLKRREPDTLRLNIGDDVFQIPLMGDLTPDEVADLGTPAGTIAFFKKHIGKKVASTLTINDFNAITDAWKAASQKASGMKPGES